MAVKLHDSSFLTSSSSNPRLSLKHTRTCFSSKNLVIWDYLLINWKNSRRRCITRLAVSEQNNHGFGFVSVGMKRDSVLLGRPRRLKGLFPLASADENVTVNGSPQASTSGDVEEMRIQLDRTLQGEEYNDGLVQSLHNAARTFELAIKERCSTSKIPWFTTAWFGVDKNSWVKVLSYQASVYSLLQATSEISSRGDRRDRDINVFVQKSLLRQYAHLESIIREKLSEKQPEIYDWFWSEQVPAVVTTFVDYFEGDSRFSAATAMSGAEMSLHSGNASDASLLMLALTSVAAITKLGPAKISCSQFFSTIPDITGRLMDMMVDFVSIQQAYDAIKKIGLRREFLSHFGPRAALYRVRSERDAEEVVFWVNLVQKQLKKAIDRERIWSRLTTSESIEVLDKDLAIFGFFIALGRRMQGFLSANGFDSIEDPIEGFIRYLIGGSVLYYPQLSSISSYQLFVEVVCEELDWLPFYPRYSGKPKQLHGHRSKQKGRPNAEAIPLALEVCSHWMQSFIKYSKWLENPANVKAAGFLSRGHNKLMECMEEMGMLISEAKERTSTQSSSREQSSGKELASFDQALESVEEALIRLELLLQELHVSNTNSGKEHLKAACSDLEKIRKLKKEAEFLEASFRAKAASLQQGDHDSHSESSDQGQQQYTRGHAKNTDNTVLDSSRSNSRGIWNLLRWPPARKSGPGFFGRDEESTKQTNVKMGIENSENGIQRFEVLRNELMELEKRVQRTADKSEKEEDVHLLDDSISGDSIARGTLVQVEKKENIVEKSIGKLKETSRDVLQGTQLLAIDVAAATGLLRRALIGDELTEKEKQALKRTMTDLASVVPIGVLMLLPVTAVGHAAMLAAIQRYFPALIPSTYGPERLDLLRQLEKVREMETNEVNSKEKVQELS